MANFQIERKIIRQGFKAIAGVDEAGRGALFGPVIAASVIFPQRMIKKNLSGWVNEIDDSKAISPRKRQRLAKLILGHAIAVGVGGATHSEIDQNNIYRASLKAMRKAVERMPVPPDFILVDGFTLNDVNYPQISVPQGDKKSTSIAAASIVAKVLRDEMMFQLNNVFEGYSLSKNKGYPTKEHFQALKEKGPTSLHRLTFNLRCK